jgi:hypothetical protein
MTRLSVITLAAAAVALHPPAGSAQTTVSLYPRVGLLAPDPYFYEQFENFAGDGPTEWTTGSLGRSLAIGGGVELKLGDSGLLVRGEIARVFGGWMLVSHSVVVPRVFFNAPYISTVWLDVPYAMTVTSVHVVLPTRVRVWGAQPYVAVGGGGKFYGFGDPTTANDAEALLPNDGFTWGVDAGAGVTARVWRNITLDVQARDLISSYWDKTQHDFLFTGALLVPVW